MAKRLPRSFMSFFTSAATFVADGGGTAGHPFALPPGFPGAAIVAQAAVLVPGPLGFAAGNAAVLVLQ